MISRTTIIYTIAMVIGGIGIAFASQAWPALRTGSFGPLIILLGFSFVFDIVTFRLGDRLGLGILTMPQRMIGFMAGALLYIVIAEALKPAAGV